MAVTRIKANQISDSAVDASKLANESITGAKLSNNLTYGSNLTISGNLTVNGTTTTVDSTTTVIADPLLLLSRGATGSASVDAGIVIERGDDDNVSFIWDESADEWVAAVTSSEDGTTAGDVSLTSYANLHVGGITSSGIDITGDIDIDNININGNTIISTDTNGDINVTPNGTGEVVLSTAAVSDLTNNRVVIAGASGALEDDANFTYDGTDLTVNSAIVGDLTDNRIVVAGTSGALEDDANLTWDGSDMGVTGGLNVTGDLAVDNIAINGNTISSTDTNGNINLTPNGTGEVVAATLTVSDLTSTRLVYATTSGSLADTSSMTWDGTDVTLSSVIVSDLTDNRLVVAGTSGALEDDSNLTWDGSTLTATGDVSSTTLQTSGEATLASATVSDLTANRVVLAGTSGALQDSANFTFNGTTMAITGAVDVTGDLDVDNINVNGNTIISTDTNGDVNITPNGTGEVVMSTATVSDLTANRIVVAGTSGALEDDGNLTWDGADLSITGGILSSDLTSGRVTYATTSGQLTDSANLAFDGTDLTVASAIVSDLTNNRIVVAGTSGALEDDSNLTWDGSDMGVTGGLNVTGDLAVDNIAINGNAITSTDAAGNITITPDTTGDLVLDGLNWPQADGSANQVIQTDGSGQLSFATVLTDIVADTTPQLGGDLDVNGNAITSASNGAIEINPNGTGTVDIGNTATVVNINGTTGSSGSALGALVVDGGVGIAENLNVGGNIVVTGNLTVEGTTTTVDSVTTQVVDPIFQIGGGAGGAALTADDDKDRGMSAKYHTGSAEKTAFWGFDDSTGRWTFVPDATISGEVVSGSAGALDVGDVYNANLTSGRVTYATTSGQLTDSANMTFDGTDLTVASAVVSDLTDNRLVVAGTSGALEDDANLTWSGSALAVTGGVDVTGDLDVDNVNINGNTIISTDTNGNINVTPNGTGEVVLSTASVSDLTSGRIVVAGSSGSLGDDTNLTWDGSDLSVGGGILSSDLTSGRVTYATTSGQLTDSGNFTFDGSTMGITATVNVTGDIDVDNLNLNGNTIISTDANGDINVTPNGTGEVVLSTATVSDLTANRIVVAGTSGALEDDGNLTYDGTDLTVNSAIVSDLTDNRIVVAGTSGALEDDANLTWDGSDMGVTGGLNVTGDLAVDNIAINGNTVSSTDTNGAINLTPNGTGEVVAATLSVSDLTATRVTYAGASGALTDSANMTFDGTDLTVASAVVSDLTDNRLVVAGTSGALEDDANLTWDGSTLTATGDVSSTTLQTSGEATLASATVSDLTSGRVVTAGTSGALQDSGTLLWDGTDLTAGSAIVSDLTSGRVVLAGTSGAIEDDGNLTFDGTTLTVTGNIAVDNITIDGNNITASSGGIVTINDASEDIDFRVEGQTDANLFVIDAGTDTVNIGTATPTTGATFKVSATDSMMIAVGSTAQRPGTGVTGMLRVNSSTNKMEYYADNQWKTADAEFTVIASDTFNGDGSTVAFTLGDTQTTAGCMVFINGVSQLPVTSYGVSGTTLTFTEAPAADDVIEVRRLTTTTTVNEIEVSANNSTDETVYLTFVDGATGAQGIETDTGLTYNPGSGLISAVGLTLSGDLTVNGTTTTISSTNTVISDTMIELNNGATSNANDLGIVMERGSTGDNAFIGWDESADKFIVGTTTATGSSTGDLTITSGTLVAATFEGNLTGDVTGNADTATEATNVTATANNATDETTYITFVDGATGTQGIETDTGLTYNPSSNTLTTSVFSGTATTAQYADLAEMYASDSEIEAGTVVHFAGNGKVAPCDVDMCSKVAGIVSTDPAHLMNSSQEGTPLALAGRVPCKVVGPVNAGDLMVSAGNGMARAEANPKLGTVIGKAIEDFSGEGEGVIEVLALMM